MNSLNSLKDKGKQSVSNLVQLGKDQPEQVQSWGITGAAAVAGALALTAAAKGLLGIVGTLASPAVSLTVGALGGGLLGWSYFQQQKQTGADGENATVTAEPTDTNRVATPAG